MRRLVLSVSPCAMLLLQTLAAQAQAPPFGQWARGDGVAHVRLEPCEGALCAINTWIGDSSNGEKVGDRLVMRVKPDGAGRLQGDAYDPQRKLTYAIDISFSQNEMTTRGCILKVACKSVSWTRLK